MKHIVSVVVITYNSAEFITETLDSIYLQTYPYIELIISDDCSTDSTISVIKEWIKTIDIHRFSNITILQSSKNTGIAPNLNRGLNLAKGRYVKPIAGDDLLVSDALESYVNHMIQNPNITYLFGKILAFGTDSVRIKEINTNIQYEKYFSMSAKEQYNCLVQSDYYIFPFPAPSFFYDREKHNKNGIDIDLTIPYIEDIPLYINITKRHKLYLLDKVTINYRACNQSIQSNSSAFYKTYILNHILIWFKFKWKYQLRKHPRLTMIKYIKNKQCVTSPPRKIWLRIECICRKFDIIYRKVRNTSINDWDNNYIY